MLVQYDQAALPSSELKPLSEFAYQPVAFDRYIDMTDNLTAEDMVDFILKMKESYRVAVDKMVSRSLTHILNRKTSHGLRESRWILFMTHSSHLLIRKLPRLTRPLRNAVLMRQNSLSSRRPISNFKLKSATETLRSMRLSLKSLKSRPRLRLLRSQSLSTT